MSNYESLFALVRESMHNNRHSMTEAIDVNGFTQVHAGVVRMLLISPRTAPKDVFPKFGAIGYDHKYLIDVESVQRFVCGDDEWTPNELVVAS